MHLSSIYEHSCISESCALVHEILHGRPASVSSVQMERKPFNQALFQIPTKGVLQRKANHFGTKQLCIIRKWESYEKCLQVINDVILQTTHCIHKFELLLHSLLVAVCQKTRNKEGWGCQFPKATPFALLKSLIRNRLISQLMHLVKIWKNWYINEGSSSSKNSINPGICGCDGWFERSHHWLVVNISQNFLISL